MSLGKAIELEKVASSKQDILELIQEFEKATITDIIKDKTFAQWKIGHYQLLLGASHSDNKKEKKEHYLNSIASSEKAMMLNEEFARAIESGGKIWNSAHLLNEEHIDAMGYWYTARCYYFKECLSIFGRIFNLSLMIHNEPVIRRIDELNPNWAGGGNFLSKAIYYIAVPKRLGGSKENSALEFEKAIAVGPNYLVHRWARAKYLWSLTGDKESYVSDLNWVLAQDPKTGGNPHAWNIYFQNEARAMLRKMNAKLS